MRVENLAAAVEKNKDIEQLANAITALESSRDIQVRVFTNTRQEYVINAWVDQEILREALLTESRRVLEKFKAELKEMGVER